MAYKRVRRTYNDDGIFFCDEESDIQALPQVGHVKIGSKAFVAETSQAYVLAKSGWQPVEFMAGGGSGGEGGSEEGSSQSKAYAKELGDGKVMNTEELFNLSSGFYYGLAGDGGDVLEHVQSAVPADEMVYATVIDTNGKVKYINLFVLGNNIGITITPDKTVKMYSNGQQIN